MPRVFSFSIILAICLFCGNYLFYHNKGIVAKINYTTSGCFYYENSNLILFKRDSFIIAELNTTGKQTQIVKLNKLQIDSFYLFVKELKRIMKNNSCTTISDYILEIDNKTIKKTDGGCEWNGFQNLKSFLFNKS